MDNQIRAIKQITCEVCGGITERHEKSIHYREYHPEYKFHLASVRQRGGKRTLIICDICNAQMGNYTTLAEKHNHSNPTSPSLLLGGNQCRTVINCSNSNGWLRENYSQIAEYYIDHNYNRSETRKNFNISDYIIFQSLYLMEFRELIPMGTLKQLTKSPSLNELKTKIKEGKGEETMVENTNTEGNLNEGISSEAIIDAIEKMIIKNRQLKTSYAELSKSHKELMDEFTSKILKGDEELIELKKQLEICQIGKRRAEDSLRKMILEKQRPIALQIAYQEERQQIEEQRT